MYYIYKTVRSKLIMNYIFFKYSTLLGACLTYHLGWVRYFCGEEMKTTSSCKLEEATSATVNKTSPGAKTVVMGSDSTIMKRLVFVLSYFIRLSGQSANLSKVELLSQKVSKPDEPDSLNIDKICMY